MCLKEEEGGVFEGRGSRRVCLKEEEEGVFEGRGGGCV